MNTIKIMQYKTLLIKVVFKINSSQVISLKMFSKNLCIFLYSTSWSLIISPYHMWCTDCCLKSLKRKAKHVYSFHSVENMALSFWQYLPSSMRSAQKRSWVDILHLSSWASLLSTVYMNENVDQISRYHGLLWHPQLKNAILIDQSDSVLSYI